MKNKRLFSFVVFLVLISLMSVFAVGFLSHGDHGSCPITMGNDCSYMNNAFAMTMHHIDGMQDLTEGVTTSGLSIALMVLSAVALFLYIRLKDSVSNTVVKFRYIYIRYTSHPVFMRMLRWIALRNKLGIYSHVRASGNSIS